MSDVVQVRRKNPVCLAMQFDGSPQSAHEILAWVFAQGGSGRYPTQHAGGEALGIGPKGIAIKGEWVVKEADGWGIISDPAFAERFEFVPYAESRR